MGKDKKMERAEEELKKLQKELRVQLDQVMKSLFGVSPRVLVNMLNSLFKEDYDPEQTGVVLTNNEFVQGYEDYDVLRGDVFFRLQDQQERPHQYHIDFQATYDDNMVIRMFEYGLSKAREVAGLEKAGDSGEATIYMPRQLVIYVEAHRDIKDQLRLRIVFPGGGEVLYTVPLMKYWEYGIQGLLEQKLYPLLPLQAFKLRRKLDLLKKRKHTPGQMQEQMQELLKEARGIAEEVGTVSCRLYDQEIITGEDLNKILTALGNLVRYLNLKYGYAGQIVEEVEKMLKTLYDPVVEEKGREEGREEGAINALQEAIIKLSQRKLGPISPETEKIILETNNLEFLKKVLDYILDIEREEELYEMLISNKAS